MRIAFDGYERDRHVRWMKVYRAKISVNGATRVSRRPFRRATTAEAYAARWAERAQTWADNLAWAAAQEQPAAEEQPAAILEAGASPEVEPALKAEVEVGA